MYAKPEMSVPLRLVVTLLALLSILAPGEALADFQVKQGSFLKSTTTGTQAVSVGFNPKVVIFYWLNRPSLEDINAGIGVADNTETIGDGIGNDNGVCEPTEGCNGRVIAFGSSNNLGGNSLKPMRAQSRDYCILTTDARNGVLTAKARFGGVVLNGFVIDWVTNDGQNPVIQYVALGGTDITQVKAGDFGMNTLAVNPQDVTSVGFQPDFMMFLNVGNSLYVTTAAENVDTTAATASIGLASSETEEASINLSFAYGTSFLTKGYQPPDIAFGTMHDNGLSKMTQAEISAMLPTGFQVTKAISDLTYTINYLAIKGGSYKVGTFAKDNTGAGATQSVTSVGFRPLGLLMMSNNQDASPATLDHARISFGASDGTNDGAMALHDFSGGTKPGMGGSKSLTDYYLASTKVASHITALEVGAPSLDAEANLTAFTANGFDLLWTSNNTESDAIIYAALADTAATAVTLSSFVATGFDGGALVEWETASELDNLGFNLYRAPSEEGPYELITAQLIPGLGSSPAGARYRYRDSGLTNGVTYFYRLEDVETTGASELHGPVSATPLPGDLVEETPPPATPSKSLITFGAPNDNRFRVLERGDYHLVLELFTEGFYAEPQDDGTVLLDIPDFEPVSEPGSPSVPVKRPWVDALSGRSVEIASVRASEIETITGLHPAGADSDGALVTPEGTVRARRRNRRSALVGSELFPAESAKVVQVGYQGETKKALLELSPLRWERSSGHLLLARRLVVELSFRGVTHDGVIRRRTRTSSDSVIARLATMRQGLYELRYEDVFRHGGGIRADRLKLSRHGEPVPFHIVGPEGERFGPGSKLYFVSDGARANPYDREAVYELDLGGDGQRMQVTTGRPTGAETQFYWKRSAYEENRLYQAALVDAPDIWLWDVMVAPARKRFPFTLDDLPAVAPPVRLAVWLQGTSDLDADPDHHVRLFVNDHLVAESSWDGKRAERIAAEVPPSLLYPGENTLEIENVGDTDARYSIVMLDRFEIESPQTLTATSGTVEGRWDETGTATVTGLAPSAIAVDVTEEPRWLRDVERRDPVTTRFGVEAGHRYLAVSPEAVLRPVVRFPKFTRLKRDSLGADLVVIAPTAFAEALAPLARLRREQGLRVEIVAIEDVYESFGFGESRPEAIRDFLTYAYHQWTKPSVKYVLLAGDATYDYKGYLQSQTTNQVPSLMVETSYLWTASDPTLAAINGDDSLPDVAMGRLPAANVDELRVMVEKILAYEGGDASLRNGALVLVADNPDAAGDFVASSEAIANGVLSNRTVQKLYLSELGAATTRNGILRAFDEGVSLMSYVGHGAIQLWADEHLLDIRDVSSLQPQPQQPLFVTMNCLNGYFHFPYFDSLAESLLKADAKGAIAAFSPSGLSLNGPAHRFHEALLDEVFNGGYERLGDAVLAAQSDYAATGAFPELIAIYHLFGDPTLTLR